MANLTTLKTTKQTMVVLKVFKAWPYILWHSSHQEVNLGELIFKAFNNRVSRSDTKGYWCWDTKDHEACLWDNVILDPYDTGKFSYLERPHVYFLADSSSGAQLDLPSLQRWWLWPPVLRVTSSDSSLLSQGPGHHGTIQAVCTPSELTNQVHEHSKNMAVLCL